MWMVHVDYEQTHSPSQLAWSDGWQPPDTHSGLIKWSRWTVRMTTVMTETYTLSWDYYYYPFLRAALCAAQACRYLIYSRGRFWGFSPHRGDTLHRWGWNLARRRGPKVPSSVPNFTPIGATTRV